MVLLSGEPVVRVLGSNGPSFLRSGGGQEFGDPVVRFREIQRSVSVRSRGFCVLGSGGPGF